MLHPPPLKKAVVLLCALLALSIGCVRKSELVETQSELAAAQEKIRLLEQQRVPKADLEKAQTAVADTREQLVGLEQTLKGTRDELVASQEMLKATERLLSLQWAKTPETVLSPALVKGTYILLDDTIRYSADAQLNFGNGVMISSPTGLMLSDKDRAIVAGDLVVETPHETVQASRALTTVNDGQRELTAESVSVTKK